MYYINQQQSQISGFYNFHENVQDGSEDDAKAEEDLTVYEVQTAPISDGVLPGVIRQIIIE